MLGVPKTFAVLQNGQGGSDISVHLQTLPRSSAISMHVENQGFRETVTQGPFYKSSFDSSFKIDLAVNSLVLLFMFSGSSVSES